MSTTGKPAEPAAPKGAVWVLGHSGMLGTALRSVLPTAGWAVRCVDRSKFDARCPDWAQLPLASGDGVVNALGLINRRLNRPEADFLRVNSLFPRLLADRCQQTGARLIHISSDCVFDGLGGPYFESSQQFARDVYGRSKREGEPTNALVIRTSIVGPESRNHYALLNWLCAQRGPVPGFVNHLWNGVTTPTLGRVISSLLEPDAWFAGLAHVYGEDLSKFDLLVLMQRALHLPVDIVPTSDRQARDTRLRSLRPGWVESFGIPPMADQLDQLRQCMDAAGRWIQPWATQPTAPSP